MGARYRYCQANGNQAFLIAEKIKSVTRSFFHGVTPKGYRIKELMEFHKDLIYSSLLLGDRLAVSQRGLEMGWVPSRMAFQGLELSDTTSLPSSLKFPHPFPLVF